MELWLYTVMHIHDSTADSSRTSEPYSGATVGARVHGFFPIPADVAHRMLVVFRAHDQTGVLQCVAVGGGLPSPLNQWAHYGRIG
jgi:hypothetical protein